MRLGGVARRVLAPVRPVLDRSLGSVVGVRTAADSFVMTYDDGPEPGGTEPVLAALAAHGATATFFVLVNRARRERTLLAELLAAGHEIALHGIDHRPLADFTPRQVRQRTADGRAELEDLVGREVTWFRPPYGRQTLGAWRAVRSTGLEPVLWGPTLQDWTAAPQADRVAGAVAEAAAGVVVLGHDGYAGPDDGVDDGPRPEVDRGDLTRQVLAGYAERGLGARSLGDALRRGTPERRLWVRR
jgi:peptidoglycan/xylan/chitin deacetylase (PgdA/CDA1 family)